MRLTADAAEPLVGRAYPTTFPEVRRADAGPASPGGEGRPGYRSFAVTYAATIVATMRTNTSAPNHRWLRNPGPHCECLHLSDMIASCRQPGPPAAFVPARIALSSKRRAPAIRFAAPGRDGDRGTPFPMRRLLDIVKVSVAIVGAIIATSVMFRTIGLLS